MNKTNLIDKIINDYEQTSLDFHASDTIRAILDKHLPDTQEPDVMGMLEDLYQKCETIQLKKTDGVFCLYAEYNGTSIRVGEDTPQQAIREAYRQWNKNKKGETR